MSQGVVGCNKFVLGLALALAACTAPSARTPEDVAKAGAFVMTAAGDVQEVARRARAYHSTNVRKRAAIEVEEAEVILRKARNARESIRKALRAAIAELEEIRAEDLANELEAAGPESNFIPDHVAEMGAEDRVERISTILAASDRHIAKIEQTVAALQDIGIPGRR